MSILVKGMKMPGSCKECWFFTEKCGGVCRISHGEGCPLVEVPTPHGPLVDRDKIEIEEDDYWAELTITAPVIIEAEGADE